MKQKNGSDLWVNQTDLGKRLGLSALTMGKKLKDLGLRSEDGQPNYKARSEGFCKAIPSRFGAPSYLWHRKRVADLVQTSGQPIEPMVSPTEKRYAKFAKTYPSWRDALPAACEMMFSLNRYAKHQSCSTKHKEAIYKLKNQFIQLLYQQGFSIECYRQTVPKRELFGFYEDSKAMRFICFTFVVDGKQYNWHQPCKFVNFKFTLTSQTKIWDWEALEKPIDLPASKFAEAKDMVRWLLDLEKQERQVAKAVAVQATAAS